MGRQGRHLWRPRWAKRLFQRGSQNGVEKVIEKGSQNESFQIAKTFKNAVRYCKNQVLRGSEKYRKIIWIQKVCKMEPLAAKGRPMGDFVTHGVDFEGSQKGVDFRSALGAQKSRWMLALGRQRGAKSPTADGQGGPLGENGP